MNEKIHLIVEKTTFDKGENTFDEGEKISG
jgi:hypothetical protein